MNNKIIILSIIILLAVSFFFLAYTEKKQANPESQNFWILYFADPKGENLDFIIENHGSEKKFHWEVYAGSDKVEQGNISLSKTYRKSLSLSKSNFDNKKITVKASAGDEKKEIYKYLDK